MKAFLDTGFLLTMLVKARGSASAWSIVGKLPDLHYSSLQHVAVANGLLRRIASPDPSDAAVATVALQRLRQYSLEEVFTAAPIDYGLAIVLASQWQEHLAGQTPPFLLLLWPALAATIGATHFLSFDPRTRQLARSAGMKLLPARL